MVKRVALSEFDSTRKTIDATKLIEEDKLVFVGFISDKQSVVMISQNKMCVVFDCASVKLQKKTSVGIIGMKFDKGDKAVFITVTDENGAFVWDEKQYSMNTISTGKRATKGKRID